MSGGSNPTQDSSSFSLGEKELSWGKVALPLPFYLIVDTHRYIGVEACVCGGGKHTFLSSQDPSQSLGFLQTRIVIRDSSDIRF